MLGARLPPRRLRSRESLEEKWVEKEGNKKGSEGGKRSPEERDFHSLRRAPSGRSVGNGRKSVATSTPVLSCLQLSRPGRREVEESMGLPAFLPHTLARPPPWRLGEDGVVNQYKGHCRPPATSLTLVQRTVEQTLARVNRPRRKSTGRPARQWTASPLNELAEKSCGL